MGTRSAIGVLHGDVAKVVYCHWDGYLSHNGKLLQENYDSVKANKLVSLGDLSSLGSQIEPPEGVVHDFDNSWQDICVFYGRDRKEDGTEFRTVLSAKELFEEFSGCEYFYIMKDDTWYVSTGGEWEFLSVALEREAAEA